MDVQKTDTKHITDGSVLVYLEAHGKPSNDSLNTSILQYPVVLFAVSFKLQDS